MAGTQAGAARASSQPLGNRPSMARCAKIVFVLLLIARTHAPAQDPVLFQVAPFIFGHSLSVDSSGNMHALWICDTATLYAIYDTLGRNISAPRILANHYAQSPQVLPCPGGSMFVWQQSTFFFNSYIFSCFFSYSDSSFSDTLALQDIYFDATRYGPVLVPITDSTFFVVWCGNGPQTLESGLFGQVLGLPLKRIGSNIFLTSDQIGTQENYTPQLSLSVPSTKVIILWMKRYSFGNTLLIRQFNSADQSLGPILTVPSDTSQKQYWGHDVAALPDGTHVVVWSAAGIDSMWNIYLRKLDSQGNPLGTESQINRLPADRYAETEVSVDLDGSFVVVWESQYNDSMRIKAQRFDPYGQAIGSDFFVAPFQNFQYRPQVFLFNKRIYVTWMAYPQEHWAAILDFVNPPVSVTADHSERPSQFSLQSYPNPFNASLTVQFSIPYEQTVQIVLYDISGRKVVEIAHSVFKSGIHSLYYDAGNQPSGVYFVSLRSDQHSLVRKVLLIK